MNERIKELTFEERATWGECPICHAKDGEKCNPDEGFFATLSVAKVPLGGAHLGRLQKAPFKVRISPVV